MIVIIDGKEIQVQNDVKIIHEDHLVEVDDQEEDAQVHITCTHEGLILDVIIGDGFVLKTNSLDLECLDGLCK